MTQEPKRESNLPYVLQWAGLTALIVAILAIGLWVLD